MPRLLTQDFSFLDQAQSEKYGSYFSALHLPEPNDGEYVRTYDGGYLNFLSRYGMILRFTEAARCPLIDHPRILQPIASRLIGRYRADLYPGIYSPALEGRERLEEELNADNISFNINVFMSGGENRPDNCGYLPKPDGSGPSDYIVVLDPDACRDYGPKEASAPAITAEAMPASDAGTNSKLWQKMREFFRRADSLPRPVKPSPLPLVLPDTPQTRLYRPLIEAFHVAWPAEEKEPAPEKIHAFWSLCRQMKGEEVLIAQWDDRNNAVSRAQRYEMRLREQGSMAKLAFAPAFV
jgi:hypothetical protein